MNEIANTVKPDRIVKKGPITTAPFFMPGSGVTLAGAVILDA